MIFGLWGGQQKFICISTKHRDWGHPSSYIEHTVMVIVVVVIVVYCNNRG